MDWVLCELYVVYVFGVQQIGLEGNVECVFLQLFDEVYCVVGYEFDF